MEHLYSWLMIFSGATIALLGTFLFAAERELKNKRRELDEFKRKQPAVPIGPLTEGQRSEAHSPAELIAQNEELLQEISSLSNRLEENQRTLNDHESEQHRLVNVQWENQHLQEEIAKLRGQLQTNESLVKSTASQHKEIVEQHTQLQTSFAESQHKADALTARNKELQEKVDALSSRLEASERSLEELRGREESGQLDNQQLLAANQQLHREIEDSHEQLKTAQSQLAESTKRDQKANEHNENLQGEIGRLKQQLEQGQAAINDLQNAQQRLAEIQLEDNKLRLENQLLQEGLQNHRVQLQESASRNQEVSDRCADLEAEVADFKKQLEDRQLKAREVENAQQQLANAESREMIYREQQQKLEALIIDLERELSEGESQVQSLEETQERLRETDRVCQELADENRQLGEEIGRWQERLATSEENQRQMSILRRQLEELQTEHARLINGKHHAQKQLTANGGAAGVSSRLESEPVAQTTADIGGELSPDSGTRDEQTPFSSVDSEATIQVTKEGLPSQTFWPSLKRKWLIGTVPALIVVVIAGTVAMGFLGNRTSTPEHSLPAPEASSDEYTVKPVSKPQTKPIPRLRGTFETIRPTQVYSGPSENSALIADIGKGMKLNVVDSAGGWLEIRSKHGRPPGFIRQEAAVRIGQN